MSEVFISYAREQELAAERIARTLQAHGYAVWRDNQLPAHRAYTDVIDERLKASKAILVLWSAEGAKSHWVRAEAEVGREGGTLVQARLDDGALPLPFNQIQCADLSDWDGDIDAPGWRKTVESVAELVGRAPRAQPSPSPPEARGGSVGPPARRPGRTAWAVAIVALLVALAIAGGVWWLKARGPTTPGPDLRVAVLPFEVAGPPDARAFADGLRNGLVSALTSDSVETVSASDAARLAGASGAADVERLRVGLVLGGAVSSDGGTLKVHVALDDPREHVTLWSRDFQGPATSPDLLEAQVVPRVANAAGIGASPALRRLSRHTASTFLEASFQMADGSPQRAADLLKGRAGLCPGACATRVRGPRRGEWKRAGRAGCRNK